MEEGAGKRIEDWERGKRENLSALRKRVELVRYFEDESSGRARGRFRRVTMVQLAIGR